MHTLFDRPCTAAAAAAGGVCVQGEFNALRDQLMRSYPDRAALFFSYDEPLSHLIYAASDMFLVPSMFEPCGLTQVGGWLNHGEPRGWGDGEFVEAKGRHVSLQARAGIAVTGQAR
jgi:hypothetical protein